jgi:phage shock protein A
MNDSINSRIRRIISGTASSIVSKIEGLAPLVVLEQAIDEVDRAIAEVKVELGRITAQKHHVTRTAVRLNEEHGRIGAQLQEAQKQGREDLVEAAISRQIDIEDQLPVLENQLKDLSEQEQNLNAAILGMLAKRNEMDEELSAFRQSQSQMQGQAISGNGDGISKGSASTGMEQAQQAFDRVLSKATGLHSTGRRSTTEESAKLVELDNLNRKARIAARMKELKEPQ